LNVRNSNENI